MINLVAVWASLIFGMGIPKSVPLAITLAHGSPAEARTRTQVTALAARYPLQPWLYTHRLVIDERSIPHSHPVLTLHTRHLGDDRLLLSTLLHEEMHWFLAQHRADAAAATAELRRRYPTLPVGYPEGADSEQASYEHLLVIDLEWKALARLLGADAALEAIRFWQGDHYRALYRIVEKDAAAITALRTQHHLVPSGL
jgi:hypothetical protein